MRKFSTDQFPRILQTSLKQQTHKNCNPPTKEEIIHAIKKMKNGKAASPDGIPAEAIKIGVETTADLLLPLFKKIWDREEIATDWKDGHIIKLPKKGDLSSCENNRGITFLSVSRKVFNWIMLERRGAQRT